MAYVAASAGQRVVKGGVEAGDLRHAGQRGGGRVDAFERGARVQRRQRREAGDRRARAGVQADRPAEARPAVHHAVADRAGIVARVRQRRPQRLRVPARAVLRIPALLAAREKRLVVRVDEGVLQAARAGVDDENPHDCASPVSGQVQSRTSGMSSRCSRM